MKNAVGGAGRDLHQVGEDGTEKRIRRALCVNGDITKVRKEFLDMRCVGARSHAAARSISCDVVNQLAIENL